MITHGDRAHYVIEGLGCGKSETSKWLSEDAQEASIKLSVQTLPTQPGGTLGAWDDYGTAALASGAFPVGLAPRGLSYEARHYLSRKLPIDLREDVFIRPGFPPLLNNPAASFKFQTVDGGMVNNNPFDYAQFALFGRPPMPEDRTAGKRAILMVAPFPDPPKFLPEGTPAPSLTGILRALYPALINQARFRISDLAPALDERDYSRFLISPVRRIPRTTLPAAGDPRPRDERFPIACGLLGGFGGFLRERFRAHDFQLGRRNCQQLLRDHLNVRKGGIVQGKPLPSGDVPVISLLGSAAEVVPLPRWPQIDGSALDRLERDINRRFDALVPALIDGQTKSRRLRFAMRRGWSWFLRGPTRQDIHGTVLADLVRRQQMRGWDPPENVARAAQTSVHRSDDVSAVMAELINPAFRFRTAAGIAKTLALPLNFVELILRELSGDGVPVHLRSWRGDIGWSLWARRPGFVARLRLVRMVARWWNEPSVD